MDESCQVQLGGKCDLFLLHRTLPTFKSTSTERTVVFYTEESEERADVRDSVVPLQLPLLFDSIECNRFFLVLKLIFKVFLGFSTVCHESNG